MVNMGIAFSATMDTGRIFYAQQLFGCNLKLEMRLHSLAASVVTSRASVWVVAVVLTRVCGNFFTVSIAITALRFRKSR